MPLDKLLMTPSVLLLDKPKGMSSNQALQHVKRILGIKKAGHTGTLDPLATGVLPICIGQSTRFSDALLMQDKCYSVKAMLGIATTTGDCAGDITEQMDVSIDPMDLQRAVDVFVGEIQQIPSMFSAIKHQGKPLYKWAREGHTGIKKPRVVNIYHNELLTYDTPYFNLEVRCSKGTYIRTLIEDIGKHLNCCAHVVELRRKEVGQWHENMAITLLDLAQYCDNIERMSQHLKPVDFFLSHLDAILLDSTQVKTLFLGQSIVSNVWGNRHKEAVRLYCNDLGHNTLDQPIFIGLGQVNEQILSSKRLFDLTKHVWFNTIHS